MARTTTLSRKAASRLSRCVAASRFYLLRSRISSPWRASSSSAGIARTASLRVISESFSRKIETDGHEL